MIPLDKPIFLTSSGTLIDYENFLLEDVDVDEVDHALKREHRFCGHYGWSVWYHSMAVEALYKANCVGKPDHTLAKLCRYHDGAEAYLKDMPAGLKMVIPGYTRLYNDVQHKVYRALCGRVPTSDEEKLIKHFDLRALSVEVFWAVQPEFWKFFPVMNDTPHLLSDIRTLDGLRQYIHLDVDVDEAK